MLPVADAEALILQLVQPPDPTQQTERLPLMQAQGRVLAEAIASHLDFPHWDNSAMDGYAVRHSDVQQATPESPVRLEVVCEIPAGIAPKAQIGPGQAARILTGAVMPAGADTVVMQEHTTRSGQQVEIQIAPAFQNFVRHQASYYQAGQPLLPMGLELRAAEIAVLAAAQCPQVTVFRQPRVAILSTGDELVAIDHPLEIGQIVDSNQYALAAAIAQCGAIPQICPHVPDERGALRQAVAQALAQADVVISSGGVSVGDYDYVEQILAELGGKIHIQSVAIKPGKPLTVATFGPESAGGQLDSARGQLYFGLPGNPVSALVTFWRFVQPALAKLRGQGGEVRSQFVGAIAAQPLKSDGKREAYLWGHLRTHPGESPQFSLAGGGHSSGNLINLAGTNAIAVLPVGVTQIAEGEAVEVMLIPGRV
jgi:molybdopterin molybdotransferase